MLGNIFGYLLLAFVIERVVNLIMSIVKDGSILEKSPIKVPLLLSIVFGLSLALTANLNIFLDIGVDFNIGILANVLTGFIIAGGSNMVNDIINFKE